eukprot:5580309-Pleurochrysis_carterae.AAC.1
MYLTYPIGIWVSSYVLHTNSEHGIVYPRSPGSTLRATLLTYSPMFTARLCMGAVEPCDEIEARSHGGPIVDGRSVRQFARQNSGNVTHWDSHLSLACYACLPFFSPV